MKFVEGWRIGKPDLVLEAPAVQKHPGDGDDPLSLRAGPDEPDGGSSGSRRSRFGRARRRSCITCWCSSRYPPATRGRRRRCGNSAAGSTATSPAWCRGRGTSRFPEGTAKLLPEGGGADLPDPLHGQRQGSRRTGRGSGSNLRREEPEYEMQTRAAANRSFHDPAERPEFRDHRAATCSSSRRGCCRSTRTATCAARRSGTS